MSEAKKNEEKKSEDQAEEEEIKLSWPPLESDPKIFNDYFHSIGLKPDVNFKEIISLVDISAFYSISGPLLGLILNFSREERTKEQKEQENNMFPKTEDVPYFMRQTHELDNACGLIAALHVFANCKNGKMEFQPESVLENFYKNAKNLSPMDRAKLLEKDEKFKKAHKHFSDKGQTDIKKQVENDFVGHYIGFVNVGGKLVEFDGVKESPRIIKEGINDGNFLDLTLEEIMRRINNKEIKEQANVMVLVDPETQFIDFLEE